MRFCFLSIALVVAICVTSTGALGEELEKGNEPAADSTPAESSFVSVVSESLMSYFESLPKKIIRRLLNDRQITDFMDDHEDQVFTQKMVTSKYVDV